MACNCSQTGGGNTQRNLGAWIQPGGCGPRNPQLWAMSDSGEYPGVRVTNAQFNRRGTRTPIQRRSGVSGRSSVVCGVQEAAPGANTITLEFEACGCAGLDASELIECEVGLLEYKYCCDEKGDPENDWSSIRHWTGIDLENDQYNNRTSYDLNDDNPLSITHTGEFAGGFTYYGLSFNEIADSMGLDTGIRVKDLVYSDRKNCKGGSCGRQTGCGDQWYAITANGNVIYQSGPGESPAVVAIPGFVPSDNALVYDQIGIYRNRLFVVTSDNVLGLNLYIADLNPSSGIPGTFTNVNYPMATVQGATRPQGFLHYNNSFWMFGTDTNTDAGTVFDVTTGGVLTQFYLNATTNTGLIGADACEGQVVFAGDGGSVVVNTGCGTELNMIPSPVATQLWGAGIRESDEIWVGGEDGNLYWTNTAGAIWNTVTLPTVGFITDIKWATPCVGYVLSTEGITGVGIATLYTTWNGGETWTATTDRLTNAPTDLATARLRIPCCSNATAQVNNVTMIGDNGAVGQIYQASIQNC